MEGRFVLGRCSSSCPYCRSDDELPAEEDNVVCELRKVMLAVLDDMREKSRDIVARIEKQPR